LVLTVGLLLVVGGAFGWLAVRLKLPRISGFILAGVLLSPSVLPILDRATVNELTTPGLVLLAVIGFAIGCSIRFKDLTGLGRAVSSITAFQGLLAWGLTIVLLIPFGALLYGGVNATSQQTWVLAFLLGAIAWPTAPAVVLALIRETRSRGQLTTVTLSIVALSDVLAVMAFGLSLEVARAMLQDDSVFSWGTGLGLPMIKLLAALAFGGAMGGALAITSHVLSPSRGTLRMAITLGAILVCLWASGHFGFSLILSTMTMGIVAVNLRGQAMGAAIEPIEGMIFLLFFVISGLFFELDGVAGVLLLAILITVARCSGKGFGAWFGARLAQAPATLTANIGFLLLPKAGLTMGLAFITRDTLGEPFGSILFNALLVSTLINMAFTPPLAKWALTRSGETGAMDRKPQTDVKPG
jgi:Kef-type K+ transport system membrane component KefB